jgi:2-dehydro-3-deoxyphosphogluconate aldolase / (4S)-4-hydroxy-2-oxoglutarate aldolase
MRAEEIMNLSPIVPVIALEHVEDALPLAEALQKGGIKIMEITLRTEAGLKAIEIISKMLPQMYVGAGTVLNADDFQKAVGHGAAFIFSPGISEELIETSKQTGIALIPGVATASEVMLAKNHGLEHCKLFPASVAGGVEMLKALSGPFPTMRFCPTGGVNLENINDFLSLENVLCAGGSWIVPKALIKEKDFKQITKLCIEAIDKIKGNRQDDEK